MKKFLNCKFLFLVAIAAISIFCLAKDSLAACTGTSPTWIANGCMPEDISDCIAAASDGDYIYFPSSPCNVNWTSGVTVDKEVTIDGRGTATSAYTKIDETGNSGRTFYVAADKVVIKGITFNGRNVNDDNNGTIHIPGPYKDWVITQNRFLSAPRGNTILAGCIGGCSTLPPYGLIASNYFVPSSGSMTIYITGDNQNDWDRPITWGDANAVIVEDNNFDGYGSLGGTDCIWGGRVVYRYNDVRNETLGEHGADQISVVDQMASCVYMDIYNNTFPISGGQDRNAAFTSRGGTASYHHNIFYEDGGWYNYTWIAILQGYRGDVGGYCDVSPNKCDGVTPASLEFDGTGTAGYPCFEQPGTSPSPNETKKGIFVDPIYEWANKFKGSTCGDGTGGTIICLVAENDCNRNHMQAGRDYILGTQRPGYSTRQCPDPRSGLAGTCDPAIAGHAGYIVAAGDNNPPTAPSGLTVN